MARLRLAVVGVGHLGKEHARILSQFPDVELVGVADVSAEQARSVANRCGARPFSDYRPLLGGVDAAVIAVPTVQHYGVAREFLRHGVSLLVEKPLAANPCEGQELVALARQHQAILQVGHIERYNPAFETVQRLGVQPRFVTGQRVGPYTGRSTDIGAVLDLMIHDLDLILALIRSQVVSVQSVGLSVVNGREDVANANVVFANGCVANLTASRVSPTPSRRMRVWGLEGQAEVDFAKRTVEWLEPTGQLAPNKTFGDPTPRVIDTPEYVEDQLTRELRDFVQSVRTGAQPRVNGEEGLEALSLAARIVEAMTLHAHREETVSVPLPSIVRGNVAA